MRKKFIPIILILIILFQNLSILIPFFEVEAASSNPITSINVTNKPSTMQIGDTVALKTEFNPSNTDDEYTLKYESSDSSVASIDSNGKIEALKEGTATITVTSINNKKDSFDVTVTNPVTGLKILNPAEKLPFGEMYSLKVQTEPSTIYNKLIKYTSSNPNVATIEGIGCFYDYSTATISVNTTTPGPTTITAYVGNVKETIDLYIYPMSSWTETTAITITNKKDALKIGDTYQLNAFITPSNATNSLITYWSSDETVATVSKNGVITALKNGKTTITAKTLDYTDSYVLTVNETGKVSEITSINIIGEQNNMLPDALFTIGVEIHPEGATGDTTPTYTSSDTSVATIDSDGMIETLKPGTTTITAKVGKFTDSYVLTVIEKTTESGKNENEGEDITPTNPPSVKIIANYVVNSSITGTLDANGVLTLTGTGAMPNYESGKAPWYSSKSEIKKIVVNNGITTLGKLSFQDCISVTSVELPTSLLEIGENTFKNCSSLTSITLNEGLTKIGLHPFEGTKLESLTIPASVKDIRSEIGYGIDTIKEYIVKEGNTEYYTHEGVLYSKPTAYENNDLLAYPIGNTRTEYTIPNGVVKIEQSALLNAKNLKKINIPNTVFMYGGDAFRGSGLTSLVVPAANLEVLSPGVWQDCTSLKTVEFKANTAKLIIGDKLPYNTFANCTSLESVIISGNIEQIYAGAFENCTSLKTVTFKGITKTIDYSSFKGCTSLKEVIWPESIVSVSKTAFTGCDNLVQKYPIGFTLQDDGYYRMSPTNIKITGTIDYEKSKEVFKILNEERVKAGLAPLVMDENLMKAATQRAAEIAVRYSHTRPDDKNYSTILPALDYSQLEGMSGSIISSAENIAAGYTTAADVMNGWMNSPGHKANILTNFKAVGVGCFYHNGRYYWTQCFLATGTGTTSFPENTTAQMTIPVSISEIELEFSKNPLQLPVGNTQTLTVIGKHKSTEWNNTFIADLDNFNWSTSDSSVVTVNNGVIKGIKDGTAKITIVSKNTSKLTASLDVTSQTMCTSIYVPKSSYEITGNTSISSLGIYANPSNAKNKTLSYSIENTYYATISDGKIIPSRNGSTNIIVRTTDGSNIIKKIPLSIKIKCTSLNVPNTSITLNDSVYLASLGIYAGPSNAYDRSLTYSIENSSIAKIENGRLIPVKSGTTKLIIKTVDGSNISKTINITVDIKCQSLYTPISISINSDTLLSSYGIVAYPSNATNRTLSYTIENTAIAKISNGKIIRVKNGTTNLIVKTTDGSNITKKIPLTVTGVNTSTNTNNQTQNKKLPFVDVNPSAWCYSAVEYVYNKGYILGTSPTTYEPGTKLTRGMIVTILNRMEGYNVVSGSCKFPDVSSSAYYYDSIKWATKVGIVHGYDDGYFRPNQPVTREELAVILRNYTDFKGENTKLTTSLNKFNDGKTVSSFAKSAVEWAVARGVITGYTDNNTIRPQGTATRDVAASMIFKYCNTK